MMEPQSLGETPKIDNLQDLPVKTRKKTDFFCSIFISVYVILLALILMFVYNQDNLNRITYPTDNQGTLCGYDAKDYPYVYYTTTTDPTKRLCLNKCPKRGDTELSCKPTNTLGCKANTNPKYQVVIYDTYLDEGRIGLFCLPTDNQLKSTILQLSNTSRKYNVLSVMDSFWMSAWISAVLGIFSFFMIHFQPYKTVPWVILLGGISCILFSVFVLTLTEGYLLAKILLAVLFLTLGIISLKTLATQQRRDSVVVCSRLVHAAALTHSDQREHDKVELSVANIMKLGKPFLLILCFIFIYFLFFYINMREVLSAWSVGQLVFKPDKAFYSVVGVGSNFLMILIIVQLIWGAFFIKQAFNFIAGTHSVYWYFSKDGEPSFLQCTELLLRYHWGSVVGGSLLQGFFYFIDLILDFVFSNSASQNERATSYGGKKSYDHPIDYDRTIQNQGNCCTDFFNLIRGEALSYVALTNLPYCNSARYCEFLSENSRFYDYSQTTNRIFRINMHIVPIFIVLCISMGNMGTAATPYAIMLIAVLCFFIVTYFLSYHAQKTEGLVTCIYVDEAMHDGDLTKAPIILETTYNDDVNNVHRKMGLGTLLCDEGAFVVK